MKVIVVGCGVVGSFIAWFLREHGIDVICVSRRKKLPHVSLIQSVMQKFREDIEMAYRSRLIYEEISKKLDINNCIKRIKSYTIVTYSRIDEVKKLVDIWRSYGISIRFLDHHDCREMPFKVYDNEVVFEGYPDYLIRVREILERLWRELKVVESTAKLHLKDDKVSVLLESGESLNGDLIVVACGAYTKSVLRNIGIKVPLIPYKCQAGLFLLKSKISSFILYDYVNRIYVRPADHTLIDIANSVNPMLKFMIAGDGNTPPLEPDESERKVEPYFKQDMLLRLRRRFSIARYVMGKADFCDTTPDSKPLILKINNIVVVSGFNGYGVEIGPAVAKAAVKLILNEKLDDYESRYLASRFSGDERTDKLPEVEAHEL